MASVLYECKAGDVLTITITPAQKPPTRHAWIEPMAETTLGWMITVQLPDGSAPQVYNVALANEREATDAVKRMLSDTTDAIIKVKSELVERTYKGG